MFGANQLIAFLTIIVIAGVGDARSPQRVIGGVPAVPGEFPHQISLRFGGKHICGGSIIGERHIITAAHCVKLIDTHRYARQLKVITGTTYSYGGQIHAVKSIICHTKYNISSSTSPDDIAIIEVEKNIPFGKYQNKIQLPTEHSMKGDLAITTGWGVESQDQKGTTVRLMKATLHTLDVAQCQKHFQKIVLSPDQICTFDRVGLGVCYGDSGGPLVKNNTLIGIASYGIPCTVGYPDVWTNVYHYLDWIKKIIPSL